jgi:hypothetical protein
MVNSQRVCQNCGEKYEAVLYKDRFCSLKCRILSDLEISANRCWLWTGYKDKDGYGSLIWHWKQMRAHTAMWEIIHGPRPENVCVCHACDVPNCCNPEHLWLGTMAENNLDRDRKHRSRKNEAGKYIPAL